MKIKTTIIERKFAELYQRMVYDKCPYPVTYGRVCCRRTPSGGLIKGDCDYYKPDVNGHEECCYDEKQ